MRTANMIYGNIRIVAGDNKVKLSATDAIAGYLAQKLKQGANITIEEVTEGGIKKLQISSTASGGATTYKALTDTSDNSFTDKDLHVPLVDEANDELDLTPTELATFFSLFDFGETTYTGKDGFYMKCNESTGKIILGALPAIPVKASVAELTTGTDDAKFATAKGLKDSEFVRVHVGTSPPSDTTMLWLDTN